MAVPGCLAGSHHEAMNEITGRLEGVTKRYEETTAVSDLDLELRGGEVLALLGPNGAGKTTSVRMLLGITRPDGGSVSILGVPPRVARMRGHVGVVLQTGNVPATLRVGEQIEQFRSYYPVPRPFGEILDISGTRGLERAMFGTLSGGQKQRVLFALALAGDPDVILLDEPTVGLDVEIRREIWSQIGLLRSEGASILLTTHDLHEAEALSDRVVVISGGKKIAEGTPREISANACDRSISCQTKLTSEGLNRLPYVSSVTFAGDVAEIRTSNAEETLKTLFELDPGLSSLEVRRARLEEAFLVLTDEGRAA